MSFSYRGCTDTVDLVTGWTSTSARPCCQFSSDRQYLSKTTRLKFRNLPRCGFSESRRRKDARTKSEIGTGRHVISLSGGSMPRRFGEFSQQRRKSNLLINAAYISPPGAPTDSMYDPVSDSSEHFELEKESPKRESLINAGLIVRLVLEEKRSLAIVFLSLVFGTTCTLSMPIFSGTSVRNFDLNSSIRLVVSITSETSSKGMKLSISYSSRYTFHISFREI